MLHESSVPYNYKMLFLSMDTDLFRFPDCYCCNYLVKEDERGGKGHTSASLLNQSGT
jgi:hypothetical protein